MTPLDSAPMAKPHGNPFWRAHGEEIITLAAAAHTAREIAEKFGVTKNVIIGLCRRKGVKLLRFKNLSREIALARQGNLVSEAEDAREAERLRLAEIAAADALEETKRAAREAGKSPRTCIKPNCRYPKQPGRDLCAGHLTAAHGPNPRAGMFDVGVGGRSSLA